MPRTAGRRQRLAGARGPYGLVPLRRRDLPLLARWLRRPRVRAWRGPTFRELAAVRRNLGNSRYSCFLILFRGRPIGALRCYDPAGDWTFDLPLDPSGTRCLDLFIGESDSLGKGLGSALLRQVSDALLAKTDVRRVIADPDAMNTASMRAFKKAGFRDTGEMLLEGKRVRLLIRVQRSIRDEIRAVTARVLMELSPREAALLRERHGIGTGKVDVLAGTFRHFSITRERIRQIEARALARLRRQDDEGPGAA